MFLYLESSFLISGKNDVSLKPLWKRINEYNCYSIKFSQSDVPLYIFEKKFLQLNVKMIFKI